MKANSRSKIVDRTDYLQVLVQLLHMAFVKAFPIQKQGH